MSVVAALAIAAQPVSAASIKFGAKLSNGIFPSNAYPGMTCDDLISGTVTGGCTLIMLQAFNGGSVTAPQNMTVTKVKIINGQGGSFKLVIARKNASGQFKVVARSTTISYATDPCNIDCVVHKFNISPLSVQAGSYLGIQTSKTSMLRCDSGGNKIALFHPALPVGGAYETPDGYSGCSLLVQAVDPI